MLENLMMFIIGILLIMLGIQNCKGNINSIHSYHRKNVREEDKLAFGRLMGSGNIIIGISIIINGIIYSYFLSLVKIGTGILLLGLFIGIALCFYACFKYNKGLF